MRIVSAAAEVIRSEDPGTAVTPYFIKQLALSGKIPTHRAGRKLLVNLDALISYLQNPDPEDNPAPAVVNGIRRIDAGGNCNGR